MRNVTITISSPEGIELYQRRGEGGVNSLLDETYKVKWKEEGGTSQMLKNADEIRKNCGEGKSVLEEVERMFLIAEGSRRAVGEVPQDCQGSHYKLNITVE